VRQRLGTLHIAAVLDVTRLHPEDLDHLESRLEIADIVNTFLEVIVVETQKFKSVDVLSGRQYLDVIG